MRPYKALHLAQGLIISCSSPPTCRICQFGNTMGWESNLSRTWELLTSYSPLFRTQAPFCHKFYQIQMVFCCRLVQHFPASLWTSTANINFFYLEQSIIHLDSQASRIHQGPLSSPCTPPRFHYPPVPWEIHPVIRRPSLSMLSYQRGVHKRFDLLIAVVHWKGT